MVSENFEEVLESVETNLKVALEECQHLGETVSIKKKKLQEKEELVKKNLEKSRSIEQEASKISVKKAEMSIEMKNFESDLQSRFQMDFETALTTKEPLKISLEQAEKDLKVLKKEVEEEAAKVNMSSIEECEKQKERSQFFTNQIGDLNSSKEELQSLITQLDSEARLSFKDTFEKVRHNFQKNFKILFMGGVADLEFVDSDDILQAGIEIIAQPPGKKMRSINLLSEGEKCLTAMALLFSLFEVKPSPFCILDEIDAPLDDTNVERFLNMVRQFTDKSQFIIITHNKRTMAICDRIFGVSMEEKGVSKLLSIEFSTDKFVGELVEA